MLAGVGPAASATTTPFRASVHDLLFCPGFDLCGAGVIQGFGTVTTTFAFATGERIFTLDSDGSTLRLLLAPTDATGARLNGTYTILEGTGSSQAQQAPARSGRSPPAHPSSVTAANFGEQSHFPRSTFGA